MEFLLKPICFLFIIFLAYFLKRAGLCKKEWASYIFAIMMNVTLPATIVSAFGSFSGDKSMFLIILVSLGATVGSYGLMLFLSRHMKNTDRVYMTVSSTGYNIGCYGMPLIQAFYGSTGVLVAIMFDIGNAFMMCGGNYAFTSVILGTDENKSNVNAKEIAKRFFQSTPVDVYIIILILMIIGIQLPQGVVDFITPIANANPFLAMFMLGLLFSLDRKPGMSKKLLAVVFYRLAVAVGVSLLCFAILPFSYQVKCIVAMALFCPIGAMAPPFIQKCNGDGELATVANSITTILSLVIMTAMAGFFGVTG